jgi:signal peptidase I
MTRQVTPPPTRWTRWRRGITHWVVRFFAVVGVLLTIYHLGFHLTQIVSGSMSPTLRGNGPGGDWVLSERVSYWFRAPRRWEIVRFENDMGVSVMKRIVASPGEGLAVVDGHLYLNAHPLDVPARVGAIHYYGYGRLGGGRTYTCATGYFILGDDSQDAQDSRFDGELAPSRVLGRAWLVVWPLSHFGFVTP